MRRLFVAVALSLLTLAGCHKTFRVPALALEECDPARFIPCVPQEAFASIPITNTGIYLTYSSRWLPGPSGQHVWDANGLGLGGWSFNFVQRYDKASRLFISGDGSWRLVDSVSLPSGEQAVPSFDGTLAYIFDSAGRHVRTVDAQLGTELIKISYDAAGLAKLDGFMDGEPIHVSVRRDSDGKARGLVGTDGGTTTLDLDSDRRLATVTNPADQQTRIKWNSVGRVESLTDPAGGVVRFTYDALGQLATSADPDGVTQKFDYKAQSNAFEIRVSTALGRHWSYRAESIRDGIRRTFTASDGTTTTETTDMHGARALKLPDGTDYNVGALPHPTWGMAAPILTPIVQTRPDGVVSRREIEYSVQPQPFLYQLAGTITTTINGQRWTQNLDPSQRTITLVDPVGRRTATTYDAHGRIVNYSAPGVAPASYTYNADGRVTSETVGAGKLACTTRYTYSAGTGAITVSRFDGVVQNIAVDKVGQPINATAGDGSTILLNYNAAGQLFQIQPPTGLTYTLGTSPAGRPTGFAPPMLKDDGSVETTAYDKDGQPVAISGLGQRAVEYSYDSGGRVTSWTFDQGKGSVSYDPGSGLRKEAIDPSGVTTHYEYAGGVTNRLAWSGPLQGSTSWTLDANGLATREVVNGTDSLDFVYDAAGNLTGIGPLSLTRDAATGLVTRTTLGAVETKQEFDSNGLLTRLTTRANGQVVLDQHYARYILGRIKSVTETGSDGKTSTTEYFYDRADRLASVRVNGRVVERDDYDPAGNRVSVTRPSGKLKAQYDLRERLLNWGATQHSWAPNGNLARRVDGKGATSFAYDDFGALRSATLADGRVIKYFVDADGRRVGRGMNGKLVVEYLYRPDGSITAELDSTGKVMSRFGYDEMGHLAVVEHGGVTYRVITDTLGSPRLIIDSRSGAIAEEITYDAWGNVTRGKASGFIPISFAGGLRDSDTGLVRFGARDYDPQTGRWTGADPIRFDGGDANLYRYAGGDPTNRVDRTGLFLPFLGPVGLGLQFYGVYRLGSALLHGSGNGNSPANGGNGNPPQGGNPPNGGGRLPFGGGTWNCSSAIGSCGPAGPGRANNWGCEKGSCGGGPNGFYCMAEHCWGPNGDLCIGTATSPCGGSWADTHLLNSARIHFDFQGAGEFIVVSDAGRPVIEARQEPPSAGTEVTFNTAVAASVNGDQIGVYAREPSFLVVNGTPADQPDITRQLPHGGTVESHGAVVRIAWPDGSGLTAIRVGDTLNYFFSASPHLVAPIRGLLGSGGGPNGFDLIGRDGLVLSRSDPDFQNKLYRQFGNSWRIKQSESLFHYWPGESTAKFTNLNIPTKPVTAASLPSDMHAKAEAICRAVGVQNQPFLDDCILDVGVTGMPAFATASATIAAAAPQSLAISASEGNLDPTAHPSTSASSPIGQYAIKIGDTVSPDHPSGGAGTIRKAGQKQFYLFSATAGAIVYVRVGPCDGDMPNFDLQDPQGHSIELKVGCGDFGPATLAQAGTYRIVTSTNQAAGHYTFALLPTTIDQYSIKIGDTVSPDHPARGAGMIAKMGEQQSYSFPARAGQIVYYSAERCEGATLWFKLLDQANGVIDLTGGCGNRGPITLRTAGVYRILVSAGRGTARYAFQIGAQPISRK